MRVLMVMCAMVAVAAAPCGAIAEPAATAAPPGRVGLLPAPWVERLETNGLSEQTALIAGGATVAALGTGVAMAAAGATTGGIAGATLFTLWLAHIPIQMAVMGTGGYLAWNYLAPAEPAVPACEPSGKPVSTPATWR